jgi:hypothetical protein
MDIKSVLSLLERREMRKKIEKEVGGMRDKVVMARSRRGER